MPPADTTAPMRKVTCFIEEKFSTFTETLDGNNSTLESHSTHITASEQRISNTKDSVSVLEERLADIEKRITALTDNLEDMEKRSHLNNIRVINLKEDAEEETQYTSFKAGYHPCLSSELAVVPKTALKLIQLTGARAGPRPVIIKLHNSRDKQRKMTVVRATPQLEHNRQWVFTLIAKGIRFILNTLN